MPPIDRLVVCHGDACSPNTIIAADGTPVGHVDLGSLGVADRWADLAVASVNLDYNYGPGWEQEFFRAYDIEPDPGAHCLLSVSLGQRRPDRCLARSNCQASGQLQVNQVDGNNRRQN